MKTAKCVPVFLTLSILLVGMVWLVTVPAYAQAPSMGEMTCYSPSGKQIACPDENPGGLDPPPPPPNLRKRAIRALNQGIELYKQGYYRQAADWYHQASLIDPSYARAFYNRGIAFEKLGDYQKALDDYRKAIDRGMGKKARKAFEDLRAWLKAKNDQKKENERERQRRAQVKKNERRADQLLKEGQVELAILLLQYNVKIYPNAYTYNNLGVALMNNGDPSEALKAFYRALDYAPLDAHIRNKIELARQKQEDKKAERKAMKGAERRRHEKEHQRKVNMAEAKGKIERMLDELEASFNGAVPQGDLKGQPPSGQQASSQVLTDSSVVDLRFMDPDKPMVVDPRVAKGQMTPAEVAHEKKMEAKTRAALMLGQLELSKGSYDTAARYYRDAAAANPGNRDLEKNWIQVTYLRDQKKYEGDKPSKGKVLLDALQFGNGDWQTSLKYLREVKQNSPDDLAARDALRFAEGMSGNLNGDFLEPEPGNAVARWDRETDNLVNKALFLQMMNQHEKAWQLLQQAHRRNPQDLEIRDMMNFGEGALVAAGAKSKN